LLEWRIAPRELNAERVASPSRKVLASCPRAPPNPPAPAHRPDAEAAGEHALAARARRSTAAS